MSLANNLMQVKLSISFFPIKKKDNELAREITKNKNAQEGNIGADKLIIGKDFSEYYKIQGEIRNYFYDKTMPWEKRANYLLAVKLFDEFNNTMLDKIDKFNIAVDQFKSNYSLGLVQDDAKIRLTDAYKPGDYPDYNLIADRFNIGIKYSPILNVDDIRFNINKEEEEKIRAIAKKEEEEKLQEAMDFLWNDKLYKPIKDIVKIFSKEDKTFHESTLENINSLVTYLESYNLNNDSKIDEIKTLIAQNLTNADSQELRDNKAYREKYANKAESVLKKIESYL